MSLGLFAYSEGTFKAFRANFKFSGNGPIPEFLQYELVQDLLTANKEIAILYSSVQRKHDAIKNKIARKFFEGNPQHFQVTEFDDIKNVDFSSNPNGIRDTRRKIFYNNEPPGLSSTEHSLSPAGPAWPSPG